MSEVSGGRDTVTSRRDLTVFAGATAAGYLLLELLRTWLPSLLVIVGEGGGSGALGIGAVALVTLAVAPVLAVGLGPVPPRIAWLLGATLLLGGRAALLLVDGGRAQLVVATVGVAGATLALVGLAGGSVRGDLARAGVLGGAALSVAVQTVLGSVDLVWRSGALGVLGSLTTVVVAGPPLLRATRALDGGRAAAAWPWGTLGPAILLLATLVAPPGRVAVATGWSPGRVGVTVIGLMLLVAGGALVAARSGPLLAGPAGAALVLLGTAAALDATGLRAVAGQALLAAGIGPAVVSGLRGGDTAPRRRGFVTGTSLLLLGVLAFGAYAGALVPLPFGIAEVMLLTAALLGGAALVSTLRGARLGRELPSALLPRFGVLTLVTAVVLAGAAALRGPEEAGPGGAPDTLDVVLANVHYGFDVEGRQRALEVGALLAGLDADLVALNEVDRGWLVSGGTDLLDVYASATGLTPVFGPAADELWGNALLTRLPVLEVQRAPLPQGEDPLARGVLTVVVELDDGSPLGVVVTHLSNGERTRDTRLAQAQAVAAVVARLRERGIPALVAGDLNAGPGDPAVVALEDVGLVRALAPARRTFPDRAARVQIDHVLLPADAMLVRADTLTTGLSDHRFVTVELRPVGAAADGDGEATTDADS